LTNQENPRTEKINKKGITSIKIKSVLIEFEIRSDPRKCKNHSLMKLKSFHIEKPKKNNPLLILYNVNSSLIVSELKKNIIDTRTSTETRTELEQNNLPTE